MFDFQNLDVYKKAKVQHKNILIILEKKIINRVIKDQLNRASTSILLNIAEGTGRFTKADKRNFYVRARGSVFECVAVLEILLESQVILVEEHNNLLIRYEELSKMLYGLIKSLS